MDREGYQDNNEDATSGGRDVISCLPVSLGLFVVVLLALFIQWLMPVAFPEEVKQPMTIVDKATALRNKHELVNRFRFMIERKNPGSDETMFMKFISEAPPTGMTEESINAMRKAAGSWLSDYLIDKVAEKKAVNYLVPWQRVDIFDRAIEMIGDLDRVVGKLRIVPGTISQALKVQFMIFENEKAEQVKDVLDLSFYIRNFHELRKLDESAVYLVADKAVRCYEKIVELIFKQSQLVLVAGSRGASLDAEYYGFRERMVKFLDNFTDVVSDFLSAINRINDLGSPSSS